MDIRILRGHEVSEANQLIKDVFMRQIAPTYVEEGIQTFLSSFNDEHILSLMKEQHLLMLEYVVLNNQYDNHHESDHLQLNQQQVFKEYMMSKLFMVYVLYLWCIIVLMKKSLAIMIKFMIL